MSHPHFHLVKTAITQADLAFRSYSGRGMYGQCCLGVVVQNLPAAIAAITEVLVSNHDFDVVKLFGHACVDNLGHDKILYFPHLKWEGPEHEGDEDEDEDEDEE